MLAYRTADGHTVTLDQVKQVFGFRDTSVGKVADVLLSGAILPVSLLLDEHPADVAYDLEAATEAEQIAAEVASDEQWLDSDISRNWDCTPTPSDMPQIDFDGISEIAL